jgi:hypothetical protein
MAGARTRLPPAHARTEVLLDPSRVAICIQLKEAISKQVKTATSSVEMRMLYL